MSKTHRAWLLSDSYIHKVSHHFSVTSNCGVDVDNSIIVTANENILKNKYSEVPLCPECCSEKICRYK